MTIGRLFKILFIAIFLLTASILSVGCEDSFSTSTPGSITTPSSESTPTPPASEYPADISGHVTIAETVNAKYQSGSNAGETMEMIPLEGQIYWIVDILVKNKSYENAVTAVGWKILVDDKVYDAQRPFMSIQSVYPMTVPVGGTGETTIRFPVPDTLKVSDTKLSYQGQEPYSYGELLGKDKVAIYDWDLKKGEQFKTETYHTSKGIIGGISDTVNLKTVKEVTGSNGEYIITYDAKTTPSVLNSAYNAKSSIANSLEISYQGGTNAPKIGSQYWTVAQTVGKNGRFAILEGIGEFRIRVVASGVDWVLKIGVE